MWGEDGEAGGKAQPEKESWGLPGTALEWLMPTAALPGSRNVLAPAQKWPAMTMSLRAGHDAGVWPEQGGRGAVCQPCPTGEWGGLAGQKATLFGAAGEMNGVLKNTTLESRLIFIPHH